MLRQEALLKIEADIDETKSYKLPNKKVINCRIKTLQTAERKLYKLPNENFTNCRMNVNMQV